MFTRVSVSGDDSWDKTKVTPTTEIPLLEEDGEELLMEDGEGILEEDASSPWLDTLAESDTWRSLTGLIRLCTEGLREDLMTEDDDYYIILNDGITTELWSDRDGTVDTSWTKITYTA